MEPVTISVIIPTYNRSKLIQRALSSLLKQTILPDEIIVIDDASTDNTKEIISNYIHKNHLLRYIQLNKNSGAQHARNIGIKEANGNFLLLLDSDNELDKNYCLEVKGFLNQNSKIDVLTNYSKVLDYANSSEESFSWNTKGNILRDILSGNTYMDYNSALIRKEKLINIGELDEKCPSFQEWDTAVRLAEISRFECIPQQLTIYHKHQEERISNNIQREVAGRYYVLHKHKALWLKEAGKGAYLNYLNIIYQSALLNDISDYAKKTVEEINEIDPLYFQKQKYNRYMQRVKGRLNRYKAVILNKIL
jgi:glycosyltransferase involved in cell wall biosynthesis